VTNRKSLRMIHLVATTFGGLGCLFQEAFLFEEDVGATVHHETVAFGLALRSQQLVERFAIDSTQSFTAKVGFGNTGKLHKGVDLLQALKCGETNQSETSI
jgi:hypothetical protein